MCHDKFKVNDLDMSIDGIVIVSYKQTTELFESSNFNVNVVIAAFVTSYARLKLFNEMKKLGKRVLYHDTDSLIFTAKPDEYMPETGNYLGDLTNEIPEEYGGHITELVAPGPKNYAYKTVYPVENPKTKCVVKGFSLNVESANILNFDSIKNKLINECDEELVINNLAIIRSNEHHLKSKEMAKKYGIKYTKRIVKKDDNWRTYPFGYKF